LPTPDWIPRQHAGRLPFALTPVLSGGRLLVRSRIDEAWAAFDVTSGDVLARASLREPVERCSAPAVAPDGRVAVLVFRSLAGGFSLEEYEADGRHRWSCPLPLPYATTEGPTPADAGIPDYPPGPGSMFAPHAGPGGMWIVCAEEWVSNNAPWRTAAIRSGDPHVVWTRNEQMLGATAEVAIFGEAGGAAGVDLVSGEPRWRAVDLAVASEVDLAGAIAAFSGYHDRNSHSIQLAVFDANSGAPRFRASTRSGYRKLAWVSPEGVVFQEEDGRIDVFSLDGEVVASGTSPARVIAFDGAQILAASKDAITCGPASEPGAWSWTLGAPTDANAATLAVAADSGWLALCDRTSGALWVYGPDQAPPDPDLPAALLGALFVAEDGNLACLFVLGDERAGEGARFVTTVWAGIGGPELLSPAVTRWRPATKPSSEYAGDRLGQMQAELGVVGAGDLYCLYVVRKNPDHATFGDKEWVAARPDTPLADLRLFPEYGSSPYTPYDWDWQDGWWYPYSTFRPATAAEQAAHRAKSLSG